jgi:hypothetical protein
VFVESGAAVKRAVAVVETVVAAAEDGSGGEPSKRRP